MEQLGIEPMQMLAQAINFLIMVVLLTKLLYKPILKALDDRKAKIEEGILYTEKAKKEFEKIETKKASIVSQAKDEAKTIIDDAKKAAKDIEADIVAKAHSEADTIRAKATSDMEAEREAMVKILREETISIATVIAQKAVQSVLTDSDHKKILEMKIRDLTASVKAVS